MDVNNSDIATEKPPVICLLGATASGKTALAFDVVDYFNAEIISVDSALVYRDMDIGTAKPDATALIRYPHHLINLVDPVQNYSAASFCTDVKNCIEAIIQRGRLPLLVGGTMLYFNALEKGLAPLPAANQKMRAHLQSEVDKKGVVEMHKRLLKIDPDSAVRIKCHDVQRIVRALEVWELTGVTLTEHHKNASSNVLPFSLHKFSLMFADRAVLHQRIASRLLAMFDAGFIDEVEMLRGKYPRLNRSLPSMRCVGYRQVWQYLEGELGYDELLEKATAATRQLAKRQLTWLRGMSKLQIVENDKRARETVLASIDKILIRSGWFAGSV